MYEVQIDAAFAATHQLRLADGSLEPLHGHDWPVTVVVAGPHTDAAGCLVDFHDLQKKLAGVLCPLEGTNLGEHPTLGPANPSAEHVARHIALELEAALGEGVRLVRVTVGEAAGCRASYIPE
ncbi:MAG: hypothetical protein BIFFINMI_02860 [Phycisphaerae bacterium]|nr:hypothetical protein [Phycisphaerae bacterium]